MIAQALIFLIRIYQLTLSKLLGPVCRFEPSCSRYAAECLRLHGAARGSWLSVRRLSRCHPFHPGGYDPPPLPKGFTLLVDGTAEVAGEDVRITPSGAVLHRPGMHADGPPPPASAGDQTGCGNDCAPVTSTATTTATSTA